MKQNKCERIKNPSWFFQKLNLTHLFLWLDYCVSLDFFFLEDFLHLQPNHRTAWSVVRTGTISLSTRKHVSSTWEWWRVVIQMSNFFFFDKKTWIGDVERERWPVLDMYVWHIKHSWAPASIKLSTGVPFRQEALRIHKPEACYYLVNCPESSWSQHFDFLKFGLLQNPKQSLIRRLPTRRQGLNQLGKENFDILHVISVKSLPAAQNTTALRILTSSCQAITLRPRRRSAVTHLPSSYLSLLEESARGSLPLDVAPAQQHKDRETCN